MMLGQRYFAIGLKFGVSIAVFVLVGVWLDRRLGTMPGLTILMTVLGTGLSMASVYRDVMEGSGDGRAGGKDGRDGNG